MQGTHQHTLPRRGTGDGRIVLFTIWQWGATVSGAAWCVFATITVSLALIDWDTTLLPDDLTLPLLWLGMVAAAMGWIPVTLSSSLWGAVAGYMSLAGVLGLQTGHWQRVWALVTLNSMQRWARGLAGKP